MRPTNPTMDSNDIIKFICNNGKMVYISFVLFMDVLEDANYILHGIDAISVSRYQEEFT